MDTRFSSLLKAKLTEAMDARINSMASGVCEDYAQYRENVGIVSGLKAAIDICDGLLSEGEA